MRNSGIRILAVAATVLAAASIIALHRGADVIIDLGPGGTAGLAEPETGLSDAGIDSRRHASPETCPPSGGGGGGIADRPPGIARNSPVIGIIADEGCSIAGTVADASGRPVEGARVLVDGRFDDPLSAVTDASGNFRIDNLKQGPHMVAVIGPKHLFQSWKFEIREGERAIADLVLAEGKTFSGRVRGTDGAPIAEARVLAYSYADGNHREAVTDGTGTFRMHGLPAGGFYRFTADKEEYCPGCDDYVNLASPSYEIVLVKPAIVEGVVVDEESGRHVPCSIFECLLDRSSRYERRNKSPLEQHGYFRLESLQPGSYTIVAVVEGYVPCDRTGLPLKEGERMTNVRIRIERGGPLRGVVLDAESNLPMQGVLVWLEAMESTLTDEKGEFSIGCFSSRTDHEVNLDVIRNDYAHLSAKVLRTEKGQPVRLMLKRGARLSGEVRRKDGTPLRGKVVVLSPKYDYGNTMYGKTAEIDVTGIYEIPGLLKGPHLVGVFLESMSIFDEQPVCEKEIEIESDQEDKLCNFVVDVEKK